MSLSGTEMPPTMRMPSMLYGTAWKQDRTTALVVSAVLTGFRGIDTACQPKHYRQDLVGEALRVLQNEHGISRESLWVQTKFTKLADQDEKQPLPYDPKAPLEEQVQQSFEKSLKELGTTYIDSIVLHSPMANKAQMTTVWQEFEKLVDAGKVREIGLSNIYHEDLLQWCFDTFRIKPTIIQNRFNVAHNVYSHTILELCASQPHRVTFQPFWTLTSNEWIGNSTILKRMSAKQNISIQSSWMWALATSKRWSSRMTDETQEAGVRWCILNGTTSADHMRSGVQVCNLIDEQTYEPSDDQITAMRTELENILWA